MPLAVSGTLLGLSSGLSSGLSLPGQLNNPAAVVLPLPGTLTQGLQATAPVTIAGWRLKIGESWLDPQDLGPTLEIQDSLETHLTTATLTLHGPHHSAFRTLTSWTRWEPLELWLVRGRPGAVRHELALKGYLLPPSRQRLQDQAELSVSLQVGDLSLLTDRHELCYELPPGAGLTLGGILRQLCALAGEAHVSIPEGPLWHGPVLLSNARLFDVLQAAGAPQGWHWRRSPGSTEGQLEAFTAPLKKPPQAPDFRWSLGHPIESLEIETPTDPPSRLQVRGSRTVTVEEGGVTTELQRTEVKSLYAPKVATHRQTEGGTLEPTGWEPAPEELRLTSVLEVETRRQGDRTLSQHVRQNGYFNPGAAQLRTRRFGEPEGPLDGYHPAESLVDVDGNHVSWSTEELTPTGEQFITHTYGPEGLVETCQDLSTWHSVIRSVKTDEGTWRLGVLVGGDGISYHQEGPGHQIQRFGQAQQIKTRYTYGPQGAVVLEHQQVFGYVARKAALGTANAEEVADGTAIVGSEAQWGLVGETHVLNSVDESGRLLGTLRTRRGYKVLQRIGGSHDFGDVQSSETRAQFRTLEVESVRYNVLNESTYETITTGPNGIPQITTHSGRPPIPRYQLSPWTQLRQQPLAHVLHCDFLERLFGPSTQTVQSPWVQSPEDAQAWAQRLHRQAAARTVRVTGPETAAAPGHTVHLQVPALGLDHRLRVRGRTRTTNRLTGEATATYVLEAL